MIASPPQNKPVIIDFTSGFNPNLSFSRASTATKTNKSGNLESVLSGIPRIDFNAITGESRGVLIEPQSTNLLKYSSLLSSSVWTKIRVSAAISEVYTPMGALSYKLVEDATDSLHYMHQAVTPTVGEVYTLSVYVKSGERSKAGLKYFSSGFTASSAFFSAQDGSIISSSGCTAKAEQLKDGWYRFSITFTVLAAVSAGVWIAMGAGTERYAGDGVSGMYFCGAQFEMLSSASSLIETTSAQVTRAADSLSIQGAVFNRFFTQSEGAIYIEFEHDRAAWPSSAPAVMCISDGTGTGEASGIVLSASAAGTSLDVSSSGVSQASMLVSNGSAAGVHRAAFSYKADSFSLSVDNATPSIDTAGTIPTLSRLDIGSVIGARHFSGWIKRIAIFPRAASSAIIQSITQ